MLALLRFLCVIHVLYVSFADLPIKNEIRSQTFHLNFQGLNSVNSRIEMKLGDLGISISRIAAITPSPQMKMQNRKLLTLLDTEHPNIHYMVGPENCRNIVNPTKCNSTNWVHLAMLLRSECTYLVFHYYGRKALAEKQRFRFEQHSRFSERECSDCHVSLIQHVIFISGYLRNSYESERFMRCFFVNSTV